MSEEAIEIEEEQEEQEAIPAGYIKEEDHAKRIGVQHKKYRDEERARVAAEERASAAEKRAQELESRSVDLSVPPLPDRYDDDFEEKIRKRDEAIARKTKHDAGLERQAEQKKTQEDARAAKMDEEIKAKVANFDSNMVKHGLNPIEVKAAADFVLSYGISETFEDVLLEDPDGALFVQYLKQNPLEIDDMKGMSALQLVNHLNGEVRQKASLLKPQTSKAPAPPITLSGGGVPELKEKWEKGAKYE